MFGLLSIVGLGPANLAWIALGLGGITLGGFGLIAALIVSPFAFFVSSAVSPR